MTKKILVICTLKDDLVKKYSDYLEYLPLSNEDTDERWEQLIQQYCPNEVIFGLQTVDENKCAIWRKLQAEGKLKFVRKGTSLHRVDFAAAKKHGIEVLNTPGVNSPFVANFIANLLLDPKQDNSTIAIIGVGDIGTKLAHQLLAANKSLILYNRSHYDFGNQHCAYLDNLDTLFQTTNHIAVCLPLTAETNGIITQQHIEAIPKNGLFICISPPRVLTAEAIIALDQRNDLRVIFDHVASGLTFIYESLNRNSLRENFLFEEKAAAGYECQYAMGEAAIQEALKKS